MKTLILSIIPLVVAAIAGIALPAAPTRAASPAPTAAFDAASDADELTEKLVLLTNGKVMRGRVHNGAEHYHLLRHGSELRLRKDAVLHITHSLPAAYQWLKLQIPQPTVVDHQRLANWCIQQELWQSAAEELLRARNLAPKNRHHAVIERRLQIAWQQAQQAKQAAMQARIRSDSAVVPAAYQQPTKPSGQLDDQQDEPLPALPEGALEQFTRRVQPILVNNCTAGGCHQSEDSRFQLNRQLLHGMSNQQSTRANLLAVLSMIDKESPQTSPLLLAGRQPHARWKVGRFTGRRARLDITLSEWVELVTHQPSPVSPSSDLQEPNVVTEDAHLTNAIHESSAATSDSNQVLQTLAVEVEAGQEAYGKAKPAAYHQPAAEALQPVDEFDPAIFNRRFRQTSSAVEQESSEADR